MEAGILVIGYELLSGETLDTNSQYLSHRLGDIGIPVLRKIVVPDRKEDIVEALDNLLDVCNLVLVSGGLGPTNDDITKITLAEYFDCELIMNKEALATIEKLLKPRYPELPETHKKQALIPEQAKVLKNTRGTASGMLFEENGKVLIAMPGVPFELKGIFEDEVIPWLKKRNGNKILVQHNIKTIGIGESAIAEKIAHVEKELPENISLAYLPGIGQVKIRLTGKGNSRRQVEKEIHDFSKKIEDLLQKYIYGHGDETVESAIGKMLLKENASLAIAESCTGGYLSHLITSVAGSSNYFLGGVISYSNKIKMQELGVKKSILEKQGAVSGECAEAMAQGVKNRFGSTYSLAITGIAGPGGGTPEKPVGTVWITCAGREGKVRSMTFVMNRGRLQNISYSAVNALNLLRKVISGID